MADRLALGNGTNPPMTRVGSAGYPARGMGTFKRRPNTEPIYAPYELTENYQDGRDVEKQARLYEESVGFPNIADDPFVYEQAKYAVLASLKDVFNVMQFLRNKWLILYRLYRGETLSQFNYGRMPLHSPTPFKIVESMHPRIMRTIFGSERWFQLYGVQAEHDQPARAQEALCRDQFRVMDYQQKTSRLVRDGLIYGTAIQKTWWRQQIIDRAFRRGRRVPDPKIPGGSRVELQAVQRKELGYDGNYSEPVSIFDFLTSPTASSIDDAEWACDRSMWADFKVKQMAELGHWKNCHLLKDHPGTHDISYGDEFKERKSYVYGVFDPREASTSPTTPHYEVVDWWGPLVVKHENGSYETKMCNVVMIEPNGPSIIARVTVNPFWHGKKPYQVWRPLDLQDELYGIGAIEMIARLSLEKDTKRNLLMAATQLEANPMWLVSDQANIPPGQLILQPGLALRVPSIQDSIAPLHLPQVSDSALKAENILEAEMREVSGVTAPVIGVNDPMGGSDKTATQSNNDLDAVNMRLSGAIANFDREITVPTLEQMAWNNQQFLSYSKVVREVGPMGIRFIDRFEIRPEDLIGQFIVQPLSGYRLSTKNMQVQQLVNLLDRAPIINQMYGPAAVKMPQLFAYILEHGFDFRNADEFITLPPDQSRLLTAIEEQELWYHGFVPPRRPDDNDQRHIVLHLDEMKQERFQLLEQSDPGTAARARAHVADHMRKVALMQEQQEKMLADMAQAAAMQGIGGESPGGAAEPGQEPGSPKVRREENEGGGPNKDTKSEAMSRAPNRGAE